MDTPDKKRRDLLDEPLRTAFRGVLVALRRQRGWSQERLAEESDMERSAISLLERGERAPGLATVLVLADALEIAPEALVAETCQRIPDATKQRVFSHRRKRPRKAKTRPGTAAKKARRRSG